MHAHGSESYWILGEGLRLGQQGDGRPAVTGDLSDRRASGGAAPAADETPAFRYSRMGPRGGRAQPAGTSARSRAAMTASGGGAGGRNPGGLHVPGTVHRP